MKTLIISDTHGFHHTLNIRPYVETIVHCGDSTNYKNIVYNQPEFDNFIKWYSELNIKNKILIAGNHDTWALKQYNIDKVKDLGIVYLHHEFYTLENKTIFGSPYTPTFGNWNFMKARNKIGRYLPLHPHRRTNRLWLHVRRPTARTNQNGN